MALPLWAACCCRSRLFEECALYGQLIVNAGELLSDFMMAKNDASHPFTDSRVYGLSVSVFTRVCLRGAWMVGATGIKANIRAELVLPPG